MPLAGAYAAAVQNPAYCFSDPVLRESVSRKNVLGQPEAVSGQFAVVFPMTGPDGARHAVKCFTHDAPHQLRRYELINEGLAALRPSWATDFTFQPEGIRVGGESYPILRMDWVEGGTLLRWLGGHLRDPGRVGRLADGFDRLVAELADAGIAHGDLQHGNILVTPDGGLRLIDYDAMFLPGVGLERYPSHETGLPGYQHPGRTAADYGPLTDRFSARLISLSLHALAADPGLLDALNPDRGEYLLLDRGDLAGPRDSERLARLDGHEDAGARDLATGVRTMLALPQRKIPPPGAPLPRVIRLAPPKQKRKRALVPATQSPAVPAAGGISNPAWLAHVRAAQQNPAARPVQHQRPVTRPRRNRKPIHYTTQSPGRVPRQNQKRRRPAVSLGPPVSGWRNVFWPVPLWVAISVLVALVIAVILTIGLSAASGSVAGLSAGSSQEFPW